jgi:alkylation response protein AidB-like acyl-CoA dehydrogenase
VILQDCLVHKDNLLGGEGNGFKIAMKGLDGGRINIGTCSLGGAQRVFDLAVNYTKERKQFQKKLSDFQNTQFKLSEILIKIHSSRLMCMFFN